MLSSLIWIPALGAAVIGLWPDTLSAKTARQLALGFAAALFAITVAIATQFDVSSSAMQFEESLDWLPQLGLHYRLGLDGLSLPLLILNSFLVGVAIYSTKEAIARHRLYYSLVLLLTAGVAGAFMAQNLLLFFLFYEVELLPLYLLIAIWGGKRRAYAATKFLIYTAVSGILLLAGFLGIVWLGHAPSFDFSDAQTAMLPTATQLPLLIVILVGLGIKTPIVPLHTWLPDAHV
ncbi:MAG: proton-conducting transporter membrane subunit, partial [Cyanobacteria bacterium P01_A01_bin.3]